MTQVLTRTHYDVLAVAPEAGAEEIRFAYRHLARVLHPDRHAGSPVGETAALRSAMAELNEAWAVLSDPARRAAYDESIGLPPRPQPGPRRPVRAWVDAAEPPRRLLALLGAAGVLGLVAAASSSGPWSGGGAPASHERDERRPSTTTSTIPPTTASTLPPTTAPVPTTTPPAPAPALSPTTTAPPTTTTTAPLVTIEVGGCPSAAVSAVSVTVTVPCP